MENKMNQTPERKRDVEILEKYKQELKEKISKNNQEEEQGTKKVSSNKTRKRKFKPIKESHKYIKRKKLRRK